MKIKGLKKIGESIENVSTIGSLVYNLLTDDVKQKWKPKKHHVVSQNQS